MEVLHEFYVLFIMEVNHYLFLDEIIFKIGLLIHKTVVQIQIAFVVLLDEVLFPFFFSLCDEVEFDSENVASNNFFGYF